MYKITRFTCLSLSFILVSCAAVSPAAPTLKSAPAEPAKAPLVFDWNEMKTNLTSMLTVSMSNGKCALKGSLKVPAGEFGIHFINQDPEKAALLGIVTIDEGKTLSDLDRWPYAYPPGWVQLVRKGELDPVKETLLTAEVKDKPLYLVCIDGYPGGFPISKIGVMGPIESIAPAAATNIPAPTAITAAQILVVRTDLIVPENSGEVKQLIELPANPGDMTDGHVYSLAWTPDGKRLAFGLLDAVQLYDVTTGKPFAELKTQIGEVNTVAFSSDGTMLAAGGGRYNPVQGGVQIWNVETQKPLLRLDDFSESVNGVAFSKNGAILVTGWGHLWVSGGVKMWNVATGELLTEFGLRSMSSSSTFLPVSDIAFNPDGTLLAVANGDGRVLLWDVTNQQEKTILNRSTKYITSLSVEFSPDGTVLATAGTAGTSDETGDIRLWDVATGTQRHVLEGHEAFVISVAFNADGRVVASASVDGTVRLWDVETGKALAKLDVPGVSIVAFSPDGKLMATNGPWGSIQLWGVPSE